MRYNDYRIWDHRDTETQRGLLTLIAESDALKSKPGPPRPEPKGSRCLCASVVDKNLLIKVARQRARGISWETIARGTGLSALELARLPFDHAEIWEPLYKRAEKLQLQEAEGEGLKALNILLEDKDRIAAEKAARELLLHRRHIERRRYRPRRRGDAEKEELLTAASVPGNTGVVTRDQESFSVPLCLRGEEAPEELTGSIIHLACRRAQGEDLLVTAAEIGRPHQEVARWAFVYARDWDRHWPTARLETARFYAARALKALTSLAFGPDRKLAARAARTLLVHRRHMHWNSSRNRRCTQTGADLSLARGEARPVMAAAPAAENHQRSSASICGSKFASWRLGGDNSGSVPPRLRGQRLPRARDGPE